MAFDPTHHPITPGTSNQTIAANQFLTGVQTIAGSANLVAGNIKSGVNIFNVVGNMKGADGTEYHGKVANKSQDLLSSSSGSDRTVLTLTTRPSILTAWSLKCSGWILLLLEYNLSIESYMIISSMPYIEGESLRCRVLSESLNKYIGVGLYSKIKFTNDFKTVILNQSNTSDKVFIGYK